MSKLKTTLPPAPTRSPNILEALPPEKAANVQGLLAPHLSEIMPADELQQYNQAYQLKLKMLKHVEAHDNNAARRDVKAMRAAMVGRVEAGEDPGIDPHLLVAQSELEKRHKIALIDAKQVIKIHNQRIHDLTQKALTRSIAIVESKITEVEARERSEAEIYGLTFEPSKTLLSLRASIRFLQALQCGPCLSHYSESKLPFIELLGI